MTEAQALSGYLDDWYLYRRELLRTLRTMWRLYLAMVILAWAFLPWRLGWRGVGLSLWLSFWCGWARFWTWFAEWMRAQQ